ncbi:MAG: hypothetical protein LUC41_03885 [Clostridiales bacterium]|nr:hypothetical protein [Clostridiales bacterium]
MTREEFKQQKIGGGEMVAYSVSNFGGNLVYATISSFATLFYTDSVGIAAATVGTSTQPTRSWGLSPSYWLTC